jgi:hypothetical protein
MTSLTVGEYYSNIAGRAVAVIVVAFFGFCRRSFEGLNQHCSSGRCGGDHAYGASVQEEYSLFRG